MINSELSFALMNNSVLKDRSYNFALRIIKLTQKLPKNIACDSLARQLIRYATSLGANVEEAEACFTKKDFTRKMRLARKDAWESKYWLNLVKDTALLYDQEVNQLIQEAEELRRNLTYLAKTSEKI